MGENMRCSECNGEYVESIGNIDLESSIIGKYTLTDSKHYKCSSCNSILLPAQTWILADEQEQKAIKEHLENMPISNFISAAETAVILGITKQALHKHRRINNGFIFSIQHGGRIEFLRKSVEQFKSTGDGRFLLRERVISRTSEADIKYLIPKAPTSNIILPPKKVQKYPVLPESIRDFFEPSSHKKYLKVVTS